MRRRNASTGKQLYSMEGNTDMRVKLEYQGERRIIPLSRPVMIERLQTKIHTTFGEELSINYENEELFIPITKQSDLDKVIALLDQSPHLTSLRLTLTPKTITSDVLDRLTNYERVPDLNLHNHTQQNGFLPYNDIVSTDRISRPFPIRSRSNPEEMPSSPSDDALIPPVRSHSMYIPPSDEALYGHSPPPGHHPLGSIMHNRHEVQHNGGVFIPEDTHAINHITPNRYTHHDFNEPDISYGFDPQSPREGDFSFDDDDPLTRLYNQRKLESYDSLFGSSSPLSTSHISVASEDRNYFRREPTYNRRGERRRPASDLIPDSVTLFEYDSDGNNSMKSDPYPPSKARHRSDWNLHKDHVDNATTYRWMQNHRDNFIRTNSNNSIGQSSNSSGMVPDYDIRTDRDLSDRVHKIALSNDVSFRWKQLRQLGAGAFGTVYLCVDLDTGKEMAMKCVETGVVNPATLKEVEVLQREMQLYRTLKHERIVQYFGTSQDNKSISIFMEYMEGGSIHDRLSRIGAFSEEETSKYCRQILEGIAYLHSKNIIHRDIKGANILLDKNDNCKLADFGASRQIQTIRSKTGCKSVQGTPYWMSPEVINGAGYGRKADVWSLGCTAVEMLTTKPPWYSFEPMAALFKIATQPTHANLPNDTTPSCVQFVEICLCREPHNRPAAQELLHYNFLSVR